MIIFYNLSKRFTLKRKRLSNARGESVTNKEYGFAVQFFVRFMKSVKLIYDE